jgi:hypothetical protein
MTLAKARLLYRVYDGKWGYDEFNAGWGDTRFAPIDDPWQCQLVVAPL